MKVEKHPWWSRSGARLFALWTAYRSRSSQISATVLCVLCVSSYVLASVVNGVVLYGVVGHIQSRMAGSSAAAERSAGTWNAGPEWSFNYFQFRKVVLERHLFNKEGTLAEVDAVDDDGRGGGQDQGSCVPTSLNLRLTGTLVSEDPAFSVATIVDQDLKIVDVYRQGEKLIDHAATVRLIQRNEVELDHEGRRECLQVEAGNFYSQAPSWGREPLPGPARRIVPEGESSIPVPETDGSGQDVVVLKASYVEEQLGEGFAKIIQAARFVPKQDEQGNPVGFRMFAIKPGTLFTRIGLKNGDTIDQVNTTSLRQIDQGFALYQAFQDESEISIRLMRQGNPVTIRVNIVD